MSESDSLESPKLRSSRRQPQTPQPYPSKCPRCESTNTKFCYYNNYNKAQPRYFCKACKRHWTNGGTLRNVPIGGGRKNKQLRQPIIITDPATMVIRNNRSIDQDRLSDSKEPYDGSYEALFVKPIGSERRDDVESYMDIEELKGLISCDFYGSFIGQELAHGDVSRLGFSKLSSSSESKPSSNDSRSLIEVLEKNENSNIATSMIMPSFQETSSFLELNNWNWKDLDTMSLEDLNKPWEDPTFKS